MPALSIESGNVAAGERAVNGKSGRYVEELESREVEELGVSSFSWDRGRLVRIRTNDGRDARGPKLKFRHFQSG
jgi:hypothetical protein